MIVKNEEKVLGRVLESAKKFADEIIIVDTGSTDKTKDIAKAFTDKIFDFEWIDDFAAARNYSFSLAEKEYVTWLDADDVITDTDVQKMTKLKEKLETDKADAVFCPYVAATDGDGKPIFTYYRERVLKRKTCPKWEGFIHECIAAKGKIIYDDFTVYHRKSEEKSEAQKDRNLLIFIKNIAKGAKLTPRDNFYYGRELYYNGMYDEALAVLERGLDRKELSTANAVESCKIISYCLSQKGDGHSALNALFKSFSFGEPRSSVLCRIGEIFKENKEYKTAIFWYKAALLSADHAKDGDFELPETREIIPLIELCYCYYKIGDIKAALYYHGRAKEVSPAHPSVIYNDKFFKNNGL